MTEATGLCPRCHSPFAAPFDSSAKCACSHPFFPNRLDDGTLGQCPVCGCAHVFRQKDFNRKIGIALMVLGVAMAYWTYGLSLVAVLVLDFIISKQVGEVGICYLCDTQFRGEKVSALPEFELALYDHYQNRKRL